MSGDEWRPIGLTVGEESEEKVKRNRASLQRPLIISPDELLEEQDVESDFSEPYIVSELNTDVKIVQLIPAVRDSIVDLPSLDPVVLIPAKDEPVLVEDKSAETSKIIVDPISAGTTTLIAIPPAVIQKIIVQPSVSTEEVDIVAPIIHGRPSRSLFVTDDGLIQLKDYKISFDVLGAGKLSEVRIALHTKEKKKYAIKIFSKIKLKKFSMLLRSSRNPIEEAYREASFLRKLKHSNIITMREFIDDPDDDNIYIVLELLNGPVIEVPSSHPFPEEKARKYFADILCGVDWIHQCEVVHRDIKPENLLVSSCGVVKIADFNFCQNLVLNPDGSEAEVLSAVAGTPAYTAPECLLPDKRFVAGRPLDVWSLGVTLFAMVIGDIPFTAVLLPELFESILNNVVVFPTNLEISSSLKDLIQQLMERDPVRRIILPQVFKHEWMTRDTPNLSESIKQKPEASGIFGSCDHHDVPVR